MKKLGVFFVLSLFVLSPFGYSFAAGDAYEIGAIQDLTGPTGDVGKPHWQGMSDYVKFINSKGGINGKNIKLNVVNYMYKVPKALKAYSNFVKDKKILGILGWGTGDSLQIAPKADKDKIVFFPGSFAKALYTPVHPYTFGLASSYADEFKVLLKYVKDNWKGSRPAKVAFIHHDSGFGRAPVAAGKEIAKALGLDIVAVVKQASATTDATPIVAQFKDKNPDFVVIQDTTKRAALDAKAIREAGLTAQILGTYYTAHASAMAKIGGKAVNGFIAVTPILPYESNTEAMAEIRAFNKKNYPAIKRRSQFYIQGWTVAKLLIAAIEKCGANPTREGVKNALDSMKDVDLGTVSKVSFSPTKHKGAMQVKMGEIKFESGMKADDVICKPITGWLDIPK